MAFQPIELEHGDEYTGTDETFLQYSLTRRIAESAKFPVKYFSTKYQSLLD